MITRDTNYSIQHLRGLSADSKPMDVPNGSSYLEMDTGTKYLFDAQNSAWIAQGEQGGDGNGGVFIVTLEYDQETGDPILPITYEELVTKLNAGQFPVIYSPSRKMYAYLDERTEGSTGALTFSTVPYMDMNGVYRYSYIVFSYNVTTEGYYKYPE